MNHPEYAHTGSRNQRVIEECAELILAITKAERFGWYNYPPDDPDRPNIIAVWEELEDVIRVCTALKDFIED